MKATAAITFLTSLILAPLVSTAKTSQPTLPSSFSIPAGQTQKFVALGLGTQNYSCATTGKFASAGALATLFDIRAIDNSPISANITQLALAIFTINRAAVTAVEKLLSKTPVELGQHFFIANPYGAPPAILPEFNFVSSQHDPSAFVIANKTGDVPAPNNPSVNVDWLELVNVQKTTPVSSGTLANTIFRLSTAGGQPPTSCTGSQTTQIPYAAKYYFYK